MKCTVPGVEELLAFIDLQSQSEQAVRKQRLEMRLRRGQQRLPGAPLGLSGPAPAHAQIQPDESVVPSRSQPSC